MLPKLASLAAAWIVVAVSFGFLANRAVDSDREK
jgi:hypothetical protein